MTCDVSSDVICIKCKGERGPASVLVRPDVPPLCKACFFASCLHKFRSSFGKASIIRNGESVALAFSGGASSLAMLKLTQMCNSKGVGRKLRFKPTVIFLNDTLLDPQEHEHLMHMSGMEYKIIYPKETEMASFDDSHRLPNSALTAVEEAIRWRRLRQLVDYTSRTLGFKYLMVGDNANQLAAACLSGCAQGRGRYLATELGFADTRFDEVTVLRPMCSLLANEVALLLHHCGLRPVVEPTPSTRQNLKFGPAVNSIQRLTQDFISSLQFAGFPSTTMAVLSAASKTLTTDEDCQDRCKLCQASLPPTGNSADVATAADAYEFSKWISRNMNSPEEYPGPTTSPSTRNLCDCCRVNQEELART